MAKPKPLRRTVRGGRPFFFSDPAVDKVLNMVVTLAGEVWALRERLAAIEGIGVRQGSLSAAEVDDYEFTPEQELRLAGQRKEFIDSLFRVLQEPAPAVSLGASPRKTGNAAGKASRSGRAAGARKPRPRRARR